ncbi:MAG TPA: alpha-glucan family phosphorylase [Casimicrobiaceae bacterium]
MTPGNVYTVEVNPRIPPRLARLSELAGNLWYSFDRPTRALFARLHPALWDAVGHNPKALLKRIDEARLTAAAADPVFLNNFNRALSAFDTYMKEPLGRPPAASQDHRELTAYFCAEFGIHESLPIYSGGLGILAGDHCKAASDRRLPFVAVGLLYRQGYFVQTVDLEGNQRADYVDSNFEDLPIAPAALPDGTPLVVEVPMAERTVRARVWRAQVGHVTLYLLDTAVAGAPERDRDIAHRLYGGDSATRLEQEIVLGVGGARALAALGIQPAAWHVNEGHSAFLVVERARELMHRGLGFDAALEAVAASTVFTTHTPVPAGHDHFNDALVVPYLAPLAREADLPVERLLALGRAPGGDDFNMTALALRGSRHHNGVSKIHGRLSSQLLERFWPEVPAEENPVRAITNGVHLQTFLATEWQDAFDRHLGAGWIQRLDDAATARQIETLPDHAFWGVRQELKAQMLHLLRHRIRQQFFRNQGSESHVDRLLRYADPSNPNVLTIGFARRFATYKRATLLFQDLDLLRAIVGDRDRPVIFVFAGKAHPADQPGQELIRTLARVSRMPGLEGRLLFLEGYDLHSARRLVSGVDVWLNNPVYPLEASGTSGMKAGINGVVNLSMLDGWWGEGYTGDNGWAIKPASSSLDAERRDREEARTFYEIMQDQVVPLYYDRGTGGYSPGWIRFAKRSMATILSRFSAARMLNEYVEEFYRPAAQQGARYLEDDGEGGKAIAAWKARVYAAWDGITMRRIDEPTRVMTFGASMRIDVAVGLNGLRPEDVAVELVLSRGLRDAGEHVRRHAFTAADALPESHEQRFTLDLKPELCGRLDYRMRMYPRHDLLTHPFELGLMRWL